MTQNPAPTHIEVHNGAQTQRLFMSFGLLNRLTLIVGGADQLPAMAGSPETQEKVLLEVFTIREKGKAPVVPESLDEIEVPLEEVAQILEWVSQHIYHFFMGQTEKAVEQAKNQQARLQALQSSAPGLVNSPSTTPAV